jgi:hypothetical protein
MIFGWFVTMWNFVAIIYPKLCDISPLYFCPTLLWHFVRRDKSPFLWNMFLTHFYILSRFNNWSAKGQAWVQWSNICSSANILKVHISLDSQLSNFVKKTGGYHNSKFKQLIVKILTLNLKCSLLKLVTFLKIFKHKLFKALTSLSVHEQTESKLVE